MLTSHLIQLIGLCARKPKAVAITGLVLAVLALLFAMQNFAMSTDTGRLISDQTEWRRNEAAVEKAFPQLTDSLLIVIDGKTPELAEDGAARLAAALQADTRHFRLIQRPDGGDYFDRQGLLFGTVDDVKAATGQLIEAQPLLGGLAYDPSLRGIGNTLATVAGGAVTTQDAASAKLTDPLNRLDAAIGAELAGQHPHFSWQTMFSPGKGDLAPPLRRIVLAQPRLDYGALQSGDDATSAIRKAAADLQIDAAHGQTMGLTGEVPLADEEFASIEENIGMVGALMALAMLVTLWLATKSAKMVAAIMATVIAGLLITLALGLAMVKTINLISVAFIPLFVGLGVDFGIQISVRYNAERRDGADPIAALELAAAAIGAPLLLAAAAIFLALAAFLPTDYIGIAELGLISGVGMLIGFALNITLLPALLVLLRPDVPAAEVGWAGAAPVDRWLERNRKGVLWGFVAAMLGSIALLPLGTFDFNPMHLRNPDQPAMKLLNALMRDPLRTPNTITLLAPNADAAKAMAAQLGKLPEVKQAMSADSLVPENQDAKLALLQDAALLMDATINPFDLAPPGDDAATVAALTKASSEMNRLAAARPGPLGAAAGKLAARFDQLAKASPAQRTAVDAMLVQPLGVTLDRLRLSLQASAVTRDTLPPEISANWLAKDGSALVQVFPAGDSADNAVLTRFAKAVQRVAPKAVGLPIVTQAAAHTVSTAFIQAGVLALILVSLLLYAVLRSVREVAFTLAPVVLSGFLTLGSCVIIQQPLNFANIIAFPLLFGVGVAFHIYFVMAWRSGQGDLLQTSLARAVVTSALATGSAFGALWLSHHPGTASMGLILMISLIWTLVCALIFEPALLGPVEPKP